MIRNFVCLKNYEVKIGHLTPESAQEIILIVNAF